MIFHYIKFAFRSLFRDKVFSLINIIGLAIGLACSFFITVYVINELSYNHFYPNKDRIYRVNTNRLDFNFETACSPYVLAERFKTEFPEIEEIVAKSSFYLS